MDSRQPAFQGELHGDEVASAMHKILLEFVGRSGVADHLSFADVPAVIKENFYGTVMSYNLGVSEKHIERYGTLGLTMATTAYRHTPFNVQIAIALYTCLSIMIDDDVLPVELIREFPPRFFDGRPQLHPVLSRFVEVLADMRNHFSPYGASVISTNSVDFVTAEMLVRDETQGGPDVKDIGYADYIRLKNGVGEAFAAFIWPRQLFPHTKTYVQAFPHVAEYICFTNDLYSFYKESKVGETDNYMTQLAVFKRQTPLEASKSLAERVISVDIVIKDILGDTPERKAWESFVVGYAEFHFRVSRYHLRDLLPEFYSQG